MNGLSIDQAEQIRGCNMPYIGSMQPSIPYGVWKINVNKRIMELSGLSLEKLPECPYINWYIKGMTVDQAAKKAIINAA